jgi:hypothetical protein
LEIDGARVSIPPQALYAGNRAEGRAALERDHFIDRRTSFQHSRPFSFHYPIDSRVPVSSPERSNRGKGVKDIAQRREPYDQKAFRIFIFRIAAHSCRH